MSEWQPLSVRRGVREPVGPVEGVPSTLVPLLRYWLQGMFGYRNPGIYGSGMARDVIFGVAARVGILLRNVDRPVDAMEEILDLCARDPDLCLDVVDATLHVAGGAEGITSAIAAVNSVWTVAPSGRGLERRVEVASAEAFNAATQPRDAASVELEEAWANVYGRNPDPSDGWDHAIKAVEHVLIPIVVPNNPKATLGTVLAEIDKKPGALSVGLQTSSKKTDSLGTLEAMLRLLWPNPDRHGGGPGAQRQPSQQEAEAVLHLAVLVVQWVRINVVV